MSSAILKKYANLLVHYCLEIQEGDKFYINSTSVAEPLIREVYRTAIEAGALVEVDMSFREKNRILVTHGTKQQLEYSPMVHRAAMYEFDAYLNIRAPFNLREEQNIDPERVKIRKAATKDMLKTYFERTATRHLKRNLCQFPTLANAQKGNFKSRFTFWILGLMTLLNVIFQQHIVYR